MQPERTSRIEPQIIEAGSLRSLLHTDSASLKASDLCLEIVTQSGRQSVFQVTGRNGIKNLSLERFKSAAILDQKLAALLPLIIRASHLQNGFYINFQGNHQAASILRQIAQAELPVNLCWLKNKRTLAVSNQEMQIGLRAKWQEQGLLITYKLTSAEGKSFHECQQIFFDNYVLIEKTLYPLSYPAGEILKAYFSQSSHALISKKDSADFLRSLQQGNLRLLEIENPEALPAVKKGTAKTSLLFELETFQEYPRLRDLQLSFDYSSESKTIVYSSNPKQEQQEQQRLEEFSEGFYRLDRAVRADRLLNFLNNPPAYLPENWQLPSLKKYRAAIKFEQARLVLELSAVITEKQVKIVPKIRISDKLLPLSYLDSFYISKEAQTCWKRSEHPKFTALRFLNIENLDSLFKILSENDIYIKKTYRYDLPYSFYNEGFISWPQAIKLLSSKDPRFDVVKDPALQKAGWLTSYLSLDPSKIRTPKGFVGNLRDYQKQGLAWMQLLCNINLGGLLADEMGLGKTIQTLAFFQWRANCSKEKMPSLVVCPASVVDNWFNEASKFTPKLKIIKLSADNIDLIENYRDKNVIFLASYTFLRLHQPKLSVIKFRDLILDEGQIIKNPASDSRKAVKKIKANLRFVLSGTPIENSLLDLWSLVDFVAPGLLGERKDYDLTKEDLLHPSDGIREWISDRTSLLTLRRTRQQVLPEIEPWKEVFHGVVLEPEEKTAYESLKKDLYRELCAKNSGIRSILKALTHLRQFANHPETCKCFIQPKAPLTASKFDYFSNLLSQLLSEDRKVVIFCQFMPLMQRIEKKLKENSTIYFKLTGSTRNRQALVDTFNLSSGSCVFLSQLKAGGVGINLTSADDIIIYDPWWNPAIELQACSRGQRMGRKGQLVVHSLHAHGTIEERMSELKAQKKELFEAMMSGKLPAFSELNKEQLLELLK